MAVVDSRLKKGILTLGGVSFACQTTNVTIKPPNMPTGDDNEEVLCGDALPPEGTGGDDSWKLAIEAVQDFDNPSGFVVYLIQHKGEEVPFTWDANDTSNFGCSGTVKAWPGDIGGTVAKRNKTSPELPIIGEPSWTFPTAPPPAPTPWAADTAYALGARVTVTGGAVLEADVAGTSGTTEPVAPATVGDTVVDGTVTWERVS